MTAKAKTSTAVRCVTQDPKDIALDGPAYLEVCTTKPTAVVTLADCLQHRCAHALTGHGCDGDQGCTGHPMCEDCQQLAGDRGIEFARVVDLPA